ncbi:MAG: hypothetical protein A2086_03025 [Spirochaetes bacterium GWD1_27_9]|nr:MAG: hypothetical protein A2Z98_14010 [Spirochaetes bacterium GWB1_27_13]OHD27411.1 MAG: hypothetical protein A2Y34_10625 [Spirochaetes bacterium GWC1_27_15]OHD31358.1 MAG: hypothetical protein A2086_03025 [Spirochaetes bacterium GWD1_27_9]
MLTIHREIINHNVIIPYEDFEKVISTLQKNEEIEIIDIKKNKKESINDLIGLGKEIWKDIEPIEFQRKERDEW